MASSIQTRKSISVRGLTYQRIRKYCLQQGKTMSSFVEDLIKEKLDAEGWPEETVLKPVKDLRFSQKVDRPPLKVEESKSSAAPKAAPKETLKDEERLPDYIPPIQNW